MPSRRYVEAVKAKRFVIMKTPSGDETKDDLPTSVLKSIDELLHLFVRWKSSRFDGLTGAVLIAGLDAVHPVAVDIHTDFD